MRLCKNIFIVVFLLSVFAVGTMSFVGTVEAAKWKKYDSFSYNTKNPDPGYKKKVSIVTYIKGTKDIKMNVYGYKTKNNKKMFIGNMENIFFYFCRFSRLIYNVILFFYK
ncbi:MAG: hypothetical protein FWH54_04330 [Methanobrevibacter sp.]|nr:hypothetical protein [Methanobrevibacter sp.]